MNILILCAGLWVLCAPLAYVTYRASHRAKYAQIWNYGDRIITFLVSLALGPILLCVCLPWKRIGNSIGDWLEKPAWW